MDSFDRLVIGALATAAAAAPPASAASAPAAAPSCSGIETPYDPFIIFFDSGSAAITPAAAAILDNAATVYRPLSHCLLVVAAHTDRAGTSAYNRALSERRARAVVAYLRQRGVRAEPRIEPYGETRPLVETGDGVEERENRRAEILIAPRDRP